MIKMELKHGLSKYNDSICLNVKMNTNGNLEIC